MKLIPRLMAWRIVFVFVRLVPRLTMDTCNPVLPSVLRGTAFEISESDCSVELAEEASEPSVKIEPPRSPNAASLVECPRNSLRLYFIIPSPLHLGDVVDLFFLVLPVLLGWSLREFTILL